MVHEVQQRHKSVGAYLAVGSLAEASRLLAELGPGARVIAGGSDLLLELDRGDRPGVHTLIDISGAPGAAEIAADPHTVWLGSGVTHAQVVQSELCRTDLTPLAQACLEVGAPQLRNTATVVGNVVTASPANDTLSALSALGAVVEIVSADGSRTLPLAEFVSGYRRVDLRPGELVSRLGVRRLRPGESAMFAKSGLRRAQAISVVHLAVRLRQIDGVVDDLVVAAGSIGPTVVVFEGLRQLVAGRGLDEAAVDEVVSAVSAEVSPIDDLRATADYRKAVLGTMVRRVLGCLVEGRSLAAWPDAPPSLDSGSLRTRQGPGGGSGDSESMSATVNGVACSGPRDPGSTLLDWLRSHAGTLGVKEGCAEGECGACTVICDGMAVLACLLAAPRAEGSEIRTVEGLASQSVLSPLQQAFVECGAVQCGFCTPGFVMSATALLDEAPLPSAEQIREALSGNLCRCTGYDSILRAVDAAAAASSAADTEAGVAAGTAVDTAISARSWQGPKAPA